MAKAAAAEAAKVAERKAEMVQRCERRLAAATFEQGMASDERVLAVRYELELAEMAFRKSLVAPDDWEERGDGVPFNCSDDFADFQVLDEALDKALDECQRLMEEPTGKHAATAVRLLTCLTTQLSRWLAAPEDGPSDDSFGAEPMSGSPVSPAGDDDEPPAVEHFGAFEGADALDGITEELLDLWTTLAATDDSSDSPFAHLAGIAAIRREVASNARGIVASIEAAGGDGLFAAPVELLRTLAGAD